MRLPYQYAILRYRHDPGSGEAMNAGVVLSCPDHRFIGIRVEKHFRRLSAAYADFDGALYRAVLTSLEESVSKMVEEAKGIFPETAYDLKKLCTQLLPDQGLAFLFGEPQLGLTMDPEKELEHLFFRMVTSFAVSDEAKEHRTDEQVWRDYESPLRKTRVTTKLQEKTFTTAVYERAFQHAYKNDRWHVLEPVSMDYVRPECIQEKATRWLGTGQALQDVQELGTLYLLLGAPRIDDRAHKKAYERGRDLLDKIQVTHEIIEEDEAEDFAKALSSEMAAHGLFEEPEST